MQLKKHNSKTPPEGKPKWWRKGIALLAAVATLAHRAASLLPQPTRAVAAVVSRLVAGLAAVAFRMCSGSTGTGA